MASLANIGTESSLRYVVQLLTPANVLANTVGKVKISKEEVDEIHTMFLDAKTSAKKLKEQDRKSVV